MQRLAWRMALDKLQNGFDSNTRSVDLLENFHTAHRTAFVEVTSSSFSFSITVKNSKD